MRHAGFLIGSILFIAMNAGAQINAANAAPAEPFSQVSLLTPAENSFNFPALPAPEGLITATRPALASVDADPTQYVQSVYETYRWQAYVGYEYLRFYEVPAITKNSNGFMYSMVYYLKDWIGLDGELNATHLSQYNTGGWFLLGAGGPRFRWSAPRGLEVWGHVMGGYSHFKPETSFGADHAPAFEVGGGVDIAAHRGRLSYRVEADMVGTRYFSTYQYSPKVSAGVVFKF